MELTPGYKETSLGEFPEDWEVGCVRDLLLSTKSGLSRRLQTLDIGIPVLTSANIQSNRLVVDELKYWYLDDPQGANVYDYVLNDGDILLCFINSMAQIGKPCLFRDIGRPAIYTTNIFRVVADKDSVSEFVFYLFCSTSFQEALQLVAKPAVNQASFTKPDFYQISVPIPPIPEQRAIATALSDVDALLDGLDRLIAKKSDLKQAAMQQLLTGKTRLPGFECEWKVKRVLDLGEVVTGGTPRTDVSEFWGDEYPWITPTDISSCRDMFSSERSLTQKGLGVLRHLPANSVLVTCIASIGKNCILKSVGACNQQINAVIPNKENCAEFLYYLFEASKQYLLANAGITATSIISKAAFAELKFRIPSFPEQTAIATVLSDMDAEIAALEQRRNKTKDIKQAMMQELLTGKTRLVTPGGSNV